VNSDNNTSILTLFLRLAALYNNSVHFTGLQLVFLVFFIMLIDRFGLKNVSILLSSSFTTNFVNAPNLEIP